MGFYDYFYGQNHKATTTTAVAQDAEIEGGEPKELVMIRRFFKLNKDLQKEFGHEDKGVEAEQQKPNEEGEAQAQDEAVAEDGLSKRHLSTPLSECKAKKPLYCRYHGAAWMTKTLDEEFKKAGIWAKGGVERLHHGNYKIQYSVPPSKKDAANAIIDKFLTQKEKDADGNETPSMFEIKEDDKGDEVDAIEKTAHRNFNENLFVERSERIARLKKDTENADHATQKAVSQLETDNFALEELAKKAWEARTDAGLAKEDPQSKKFKEWAEQNEDWQKYRAAESKFHEDYNYLRANQDLGHLQTSADVIELMDHLNNQIDKVGAYIKADAALKELKAKMGIKQMPKNLSITEEYKAATSEVRFLGKKLSAAHQKCVEANESGDIKKQRAAAHELEIILRDLEDNKEAVDKAYEVAKKYEDYLNSHSIEQMKEESKKSTEEKKAKEAALAAEKAAAEAAANAEAGNGGSGEEVPNGETPKTEEKPNESNGGEGTKKTYSEAEVKGMFETVQDELKKLYKEAGYEKAIELQKQIEDATGKSIFETPEIATAAMNCFHSGTWEVWNGDGVSDMLDIYNNFTEFDKPEKLIYSYKKLADEVKEFVAQAEKFVAEKGIGKGGSKTAKSEKPKASGDIYEDFLTGGNDDTATLYGDAGLSADHEYDKYVKKMDDAIDAAKNKCANYAGKNKSEFVKLVAKHLKEDLKAIADEQSLGAEGKTKGHAEKIAASKKDDGASKGSGMTWSKEDAKGQINKAIGGEKDGIKPVFMDELEDAYCYSLKSGKNGHIEAYVSKKDGSVKFGLMDDEDGWGNESSDLNEVIKAYEKNEGGSSSSGNSSSTITKAPAAPKELSDAAKAAGISSVKPDSSVKNADGSVDDQYILGTKGEGTLEAIVKKDKDGKITGITYGVQDNDDFHFESKDLAEVKKLFESEYGEKKPEAKSKPKSAAAQYTANLNKGKKSKGSAAKPAKKTTKDVATGDPMIDGIVSTAFNFVKSGKKATTIPLPEDVSYSKIAKALNELGCQTAMSGEPDSKGYGITVTPPKED